MDLTTTYMGLTLKNPLVLSASPLTNSVDKVKAVEDAGAAAVVMHSLFEEQIIHDQQEIDHFLTTTSHNYAEALDYFPEPEEYRNLHAEEYLEQLRKLKEALEIPVIGSLNGVSAGGWMKYAAEMEKAGADAIELNIYYVATDPNITCAEVEQMYLDDLKTVKQTVSIPVAMKLSPFFTAFGNMAKRLDEAGADALVLFNRFYQPDIDLERLEVTPNLQFSTSYEIRLPLRWIAILYGKVKASLAATSGVHNPEDALKLIMAGADVTMMTSAVLEHGPYAFERMLKGMTRWMEEHEYESIQQMKGSMSYQHVAEPAAYERANYIRMLQSYRF